MLDEVDQLDSRNQEVLYTIFEWPALPGSSLVLVGIANSLDLTDRILPRLQALPNLKPKLLHFPPYSKAEIVKIINYRIKEVCNMLLYCEFLFSQPGGRVHLGWKL